MDLFTQIMAAIFTPILLVIIFLYQRNKNKLLTDILRENKDLSNQHGKVAKTALDYANTFDIGKLESIIKREMELEYKQKIKEKDDKLTKHQEGIHKGSNRVAEEVVLPLISELLFQLAMKNNEERKKALVNMPKSISDIMQKCLNEVDKKIAKERRKALDSLK